MGRTVGVDATAVTLRRLALPLRRPHRAAHGREDVRDLILVELHLADGTVGWGECSALARPTYTGEYTAGAWAVLRDELVPSLLRGAPLDVVGHPMAVASLVTAASDALLRSVDRSMGEELAAILGGTPAPSSPWTAVVGRGDEVDEVVDAVATALQRGPAMVKVKVTPAAADLEAVRAVRATWPDLSLAVDFNGTADRTALAALDGLDLAYVEQPAPADELVTSAWLQTQTGLPLALDESIRSPGDLAAAVALGAGRLVNVKPARCGGPHRAVELVAAARNAGIGAFVGGMVESGVGRAAALAVASVPGLAHPTDLGPSIAYVDRDVTEPIVLDARRQVVVPAGPGIGRVPDPAALDALTVDRLHLVADPTDG